jgi:hypothetical protein
VRAHHAQKNELKPWLRKQWVIPPAANAEFVCAMEDTLEVYARPYDPRRPQVCLDECSKQLVAETRRPLPAEPGQVERYDDEYARCGTANLFMLFEPWAGFRHVKVTERRTAVDFAEVLRDLVEVHYPHAERIVLIMDNLNTHKLASLYQAFPPEQARQPIERLEIHPPKHGSWLNRAEIELSALATQCLGRRIADSDTLTREVAAWQEARNTTGGTVNWRFTTYEADPRSLGQGASPVRTLIVLPLGINSVPLSIPGPSRFRCCPGDDVLPLGDVLAPGQFQDQALVERGDDREVEAVEAFHGRKPGGPNTPLDQAPFPVDQFLLAQAQQVGREVGPFLGTLFRQLVVLTQEGGELQGFQVMGQQHVGRWAGGGRGVESVKVV